jgi:hypothetical protein
MGTGAPTPVVIPVHAAPKKGSVPDVRPTRPSQAEVDPAPGPHCRQARFSGAPSASVAEVVDWLGGDLILAVLAALVYGGPCGAVVGLVLWSVWFLVGRRAGAPDSDPSPPA